MNRVAIIDYGAGNLDSVVRAVQECGGDPFITSGPADLQSASRVILPGVGTFPDGMRQLRERGYAEALGPDVRDRHVPFLGICLGMQLLATRGLEGGDTPGLAWIEGEVRRLEPRDSERIPHVGWNEVVPVRAEGGELLRGLESGSDFYFVHSFHLVPARQEEVIARTPYGGGFVSAVRRGTVYGVQFHPEKSQRRGFHLLRNFLQL